MLPLFSMAVQRSIDELNGRVQAFIKEKCTAIHPVGGVALPQGRARRARAAAAARATGPAEMDPIVFPDVYPLYALADIRGSSTQRALAIQADLLAQLGLARDVLRAAHATRLLPALDELRYRIARAHRAGRARPALGRRGRRHRVPARRRSSRCSPHLETFGAARARARRRRTATALDPRLRHGVRAAARFEESVTRLNETISSYLDLEEQAAQGMFPHYFEKQKTDGVDYQIYVGASLLEDGAFDPLYLKNLRLWQLMVSCGIAARAEQLKERLPVPLETTHLDPRAARAAVHPLPLRREALRRRRRVQHPLRDRQEAHRQGADQGHERALTQPGKIAIVYSQPAEAAEYRDYIEYLQSLGYLRRGSRSSSSRSCRACRACARCA